VATINEKNVFSPITNRYSIIYFNIRTETIEEENDTLKNEDKREQSNSL
jgi:hypothetical protein